MTDFNSLPDITLTIADRERLERLVIASIERFPTTADYLAREIERARIIEPAQAADDLVLMGSCVDFRDDVTGQVRRITLVYPARRRCLRGKDIRDDAGWRCADRPIEKPIDRMADAGR